MNAHYRRQDGVPDIPTGIPGITDSAKVVDGATTGLAVDTAVPSGPAQSASPLDPQRTAIIITESQTATPTSTTPSETSSVENTAASSRSIPMSTVIGACVGAVIGASAFILLAVYFYRRYSQSLKKRHYRRCGPRSVFSEAPRSEFSHAPRSEFSHAPRSEFSHAPRSEFSYAPRSEFSAAPRSVFSDARNGRADDERRRSKAEAWDKLNDNDMEDKWESMNSDKQPVNREVKEMDTLSPSSMGVFQKSPSSVSYSNYHTAEDSPTTVAFKTNHPYASSKSAVPDAKELLGREPQNLPNQIDPGPPLSWGEVVQDRQPKGFANPFFTAVE